MNKLSSEKQTQDLMGHLIDFTIATGFRDLPGPVIDHAKQQILDTIGVTIGGSSAKGCKEVIELVKEWDGNKQCTIPVYGSKVPAPLAGLAIGPMTRALDFGDTCPEAGHVSEYVLPALLPVSELRGTVSGKEFITAFVLGCEILIRIGEPAFTVKPLYDQHKYCMFRYFGPTAAVAKLLQLDKETMWNAMGLVYNQAGGDLQMYEDGALSVRVQHGFVAEAAIKSALLSLKGITGTRNILQGKRGGLYVGFYSEHKELSITTEGLGEDWKMLHTSPKLYPCCGYSHQAIDAVLDIVRNYNVYPGQIQKIQTELATDAYKFIAEPQEVRWNPHTIPDAQFSLPYLIATAVVKRSVSLEDFTDDGLFNQEVRALMPRIEAHPDPKLARKHVAAARVHVTTLDGRQLSKEVIYRSGHWKNPASTGQIIEKFKSLIPYSARPLAKEKVDALVDHLLNLEHVNDMKQIVALLI